MRDSRSPRHTSTRSRKEPRHPVTVRISLDDGSFVIQGSDPHVDAILAALKRRGVKVQVETRGLCG
jgi:hypothetical protein